MRASTHLTDPEFYWKQVDTRIQLEDYVGTDGWLLYLQRDRLPDPEWLPPRKEMAAIRLRMGLSETLECSPSGIPQPASC